MSLPPAASAPSTIVTTSSSSSSSSSGGVAGGGSNGEPLQRYRHETERPADALVRSASESLVDTDEQMLHFAQMQAMRDEELNQLRARISECNKMLKETEETNRLLHLQQKVLKDEIREMERAQKREGANLLYLKNIVVKYMITKDNDVRIACWSRH